MASGRKSVASTDDRVHNSKGSIPDVLKLVRMHDRMPVRCSPVTKQRTPAKALYQSGYTVF